MYHLIMGRAIRFERRQERQNVLSYRYPFLCIKCIIIYKNRKKLGKKDRKYCRPCPAFLLLLIDASNINKRSYKFLCVKMDAVG